ncbi:MAG: F0F1 ATP synthase subunit delta [Burkholderiaceae bacterium]|nr:F0F1 ATP synthase subunit delta [Burkholderiaceae bacterium]
MAELSTIARPYAEALFAAVKDGDLNAALLEVETLAVIAAHPQVRALALSPTVDDAHLIEVMQAGVKSPLSSHAQHFLNTLVRNNRVVALPEIARQFRTLKNASEGQADAVIESAFPMTQAQLDELLGALEKKFGIKLKASVSVNSALIGGVKVTVGDEVLDSSVQAQLEQMRIALTA